MTADDKIHNICLVGSGGVGTIASLVLSKSGRANVTSILRSKYEIVAEKGWDIDSVDHGVIKGWKPHRIVATIPDAATTPDGKKVVYDYVVVSTKQLPEQYCVADLIRPVVTEGHTTILLIQNGLGIELPLINAYPHNTTLSGVSMIGSRVIEPNGICQTGTERLVMGPHFHEGLPREEQIAAGNKFAELYKAGGCKSCVVELDMLKARWQKLLWNGAFNTLCAVMGMDVGQIQSSGARESMVVPMMYEMISIARAADGVEFDSVEKVVRGLAYGLPDDCPYRPSMLLDAELGRTMEVEVILGNAVRRAKEAGVGCPKLESVYHLLKTLQWKNDSKALGRVSSAGSGKVDGSLLM